MAFFTRKRKKTTTNIKNCNSIWIFTFTFLLHFAPLIRGVDSIIAILGGVPIEAEPQRTPTTKRTISANQKHFATLEEEEDEESNSKRIRPYTTDAQPPPPFVVLQIARRGKRFAHCTGTLIDHRLALTAKHCVNSLKSGKSNNNNNNAQFQVMYDRTLWPDDYDDENDEDTTINTNNNISKRKKHIKRSINNNNNNDDNNKSNLTIASAPTTYAPTTSAPTTTTITTTTTTKTTTTRTTITSIKTSSSSITTSRNSSTSSRSKNGKKEKKWSKFDFVIINVTRIIRHPDRRIDIALLRLEHAPRTRAFARLRLSSTRGRSAKSTKSENELIDEGDYQDADYQSVDRENDLEEESKIDDDDNCAIGSVVRFYGYGRVHSARRPPANHRLHTMRTVITDCEHRIRNSSATRSADKRKNSNSKRLSADSKSKFRKHSPILATWSIDRAACFGDSGGPLAIHAIDARYRRRSTSSSSTSSRLSSSVVVIAIETAIEYRPYNQNSYAIPNSDDDLEDHQNIANSSNTTTTEISTIFEKRAEKNQKIKTLDTAKSKIKRAKIKRKKSTLDRKICTRGAETYYVKIDAFARFLRKHCPACVARSSHDPIYFGTDNDNNRRNRNNNNDYNSYNYYDNYDRHNNNNYYYRYHRNHPYYRRHNNDYYNYNYYNRNHYRI